MFEEVGKIGMARVLAMSHRLSNYRIIRGRPPVPVTSDNILEGCCTASQMLALGPVPENSS